MEVKDTKKKSTTATSGIMVSYKRMLDDIIDETYRGDGKILKYKSYFITLDTKQPKSMLGVYKRNDKSIKVFHLLQENNKYNIVVLIHEVSHHIEYEQRGESGHGVEFYKIHQALLFSALDMEILKVDDVKKSMWKSSNGEKLAKMLRLYHPKPIVYKQGLKIIYIYNSFTMKEELKEMKYQWNNIDRCWYREISQEDIPKEVVLLTEGLMINGNDIILGDGQAVATRIKAIISVEGDTYSIKNDLKELGYIWDSIGKFWKKSVMNDEIQKEETRVKEIVSDNCIVKIKL